MFEFAAEPTLDQELAVEPEAGVALLLLEAMAPPTALVAAEETDPETDPDPETEGMLDQELELELDVELFAVLELDVDLLADELDVELDLLEDELADEVLLDELELVLVVDLELIPEPTLATAADKRDILSSNRVNENAQNTGRLICRRRAFYLPGLKQYLPGRRAVIRVSPEASNPGRQRT